MIVLFNRTKGKIRPKELKQPLAPHELRGKFRTFISGVKHLLRVMNLIKHLGRAVNVVKRCLGVSHGSNQLAHQHFGRFLISTNGVSWLRGQRFGKLFTETDIVNDEAVEFLLAAYWVCPTAIGAADSLEERMRAQRLVEIHRTLNRCVEAREQLGGNDDELKWVANVAESVLDACFGSAVNVPLVPLRGIIFHGCHHYCALFSRLK